MMKSFMFSVPLHVAAGNHEIEYDNATGETFKFYENYFYNPNRIADAQFIPVSNNAKNSPSSTSLSYYTSSYDYGNSYYSYHHGLIHVIVLNSFSFRNGTKSKQYLWLLNELSNNYNRALTPWLIVTFHCPFYTTFVGHNNEIEAKEMKIIIEELFTTYGVNFVFNGHDHGYFRSKPLKFHRNNTQIHTNVGDNRTFMNSADGTEVVIDTTEKSPIYMTIGAGGNREHHSRAYIHPNKKEYWIEKRDLQDYGYANLFFKNATHVLHNWIQVHNNNDNSNNFDNSGGNNMRIHDHVWIYNHHYNHDQLHQAQVSNI